MISYKFEFKLPVEDEDSEARVLDIFRLLYTHNCPFSYSRWMSIAPPHIDHITFGQFSAEGKERTKEWIATWNCFDKIVNHITIQQV